MLLDIDFDFLVKETRQHDFGYFEAPFFMDDVWSIRFTTAYGNPYEPSDLTLEMILDDDSLEKIVSFVEECEIDNWAVSDSHLFAYRYIEDLIKEYGNVRKTLELLQIVHIDKHSDVGVLAEKIHAGNWLRYIIKNYIKESNQSEVYWINKINSDHRHNHAFDKKDVRKLVKIRDLSFLEKLNPFKINNLFLCRSSAWVPPWLDESYFLLQSRLEKLLGKPIFYAPIPKKREWNYDKMVDIALKERQIIKDLIEKN